MVLNVDFQLENVHNRESDAHGMRDARSVTCILRLVVVRANYSNLTRLQN